MKFKRGFTILDAVVYIILAVFILIAVVIAWSSGLNPLRNLFVDDNVATVKQTCNTYCLSKLDSFCDKTLELKTDDLPLGIDSVWGTCYAYSNNPSYAVYAIGTCPNLCSSDISTTVYVRDPEKVIYSSFAQTNNIPLVAQYGSLEVRYLDSLSLAPKGNSNEYEFLKGGWATSSDKELYIEFIPLPPKDSHVPQGCKAGVPVYLIKERYDLNSKRLGRDKIVGTVIKSKEGIEYGGEEYFKVCVDESLMVPENRGFLPNNLYISKDSFFVFDSKDKPDIQGHCFAIITNLQSSK